MIGQWKRKSGLKVLERGHRKRERQRQKDKTEAVGEDEPEPHSPRSHKNWRFLR